MVFALVGCLSLILSAWALGLIRQNEHGRSITVDMSLPCLSTGHAEVLFTSKLATARLNVVRRVTDYLSRVGRSESASETDSVTIELRISDVQGKRITYEFLRACRFDIDLRTNFPIGRFWDGFARPLKTHRPLVPLVPGFNYAISGSDVLVLGNDIAFISFEPQHGFMETHGASRGGFEQAVSVSGDYGTSPRIALTSEVDVPVRFDEVRSYGSAATPTISVDNDYQRIRSSVDFVQQNEMVHTGSLDAPPPHGIFEGVEATDSTMKRLEDFLVFIAAATFGVAVGPALDLLMVRQQERRARRSAQ